MVAYVVATLLSVWWLRSIDATWLRAIVALLPVPAVALAMRAIMRYIRDADELQRRIELEAVSFATALVSLVYLAAGFLQTAKVIDIPSSVAMIWVFPLICLSYGLAKLAIARRFA
jgi:1,4-dihydroxy-2-naphthoate octaprenyltransferase